MGAHSNLSSLFLLWFYSMYKEGTLTTPLTPPKKLYSTIDKKDKNSIISRRESFSICRLNSTKIIMYTSNILAHH